MIAYPLLYCFTLRGIKITRTCYASPKRKQLSRSKKDAILDEQKDRCFYCGMTFGDWFHDGRKAVCVDTVFDHVLPFVYSRNNSVNNFVAACTICNAINGAKIFDTLLEVGEYIRERRINKGYPTRVEWGNYAVRKLKAEHNLNAATAAGIFDPITADLTTEQVEEKLELLKTAKKALGFISKRSLIGPMKSTH